jgi:tRNA(His) guanylyltransferase
MAASSEESIYKMGEEMKKYEKVLGDIKLSPESFWIIRIDGKKFSSFTSVFKKKGKLRNQAIATSMERTAADVLKEFNALTAYTQSDEITLVFAPKRYFYEKAIENGDTENIEKLKKALETNELPFNGKVQKIVSLAAGYASARFNHHLRSFMNDARPDTFTPEQEGRIGKAYFDARVFELPTAELAWKCVMWRIKDAIRASKNGFGYAHFSPKQLHKLTSNQVIQKVLDEKGINYYDLSIFEQEGVVIKLQLQDLSVLNPKTNQYETAIRSHITYFTTHDLKRHGIDLLFTKKIDISFLYK